MKVKHLCKEGIIHGPKDVEITGLCANSKVVAPGNLFIARRGKSFDGNAFIPQAIAAGAHAILTDLHNPFLKTTQIVVPDVDALLPALCARFYNDPSKKLLTIGVTGTNGKTITTFLIRHLFDRCGLMGTIECDTGMHQFSSILTTPDIITTNKLLKDMVRSGCSAAVLEVTSHAIDQKRISGIDFDIGLFTNLTQDHLDYHETMEHYADSKAAFFASLKPEATAIVNADCPWMSHMIKECHAPVLTYGIENSADLMATDIAYTPEGTTFTVHYQGDIYSAFSPLLGNYNVSNMLGAMAVGIVQHRAIPEMLKRIAHFPGVLGRMQRIPNGRGVSAFVDFAHTPDALKQVLTVLNTFKKKRIITLFGCGGGRDADKRAKMGAIATELSDFVFITSDNPRSEDPLAICNAIAKGCRDTYAIEIDRERAIFHAIEMAEEGDIVLITGRGHEKYQVIGNRHMPLDDVEVATRAFSVDTFSPARV